MPPHARKTRGPESEASSPERPLQVRRRDVLRATLPEASGNVGFLGFSSDGSAYHVVVPVDVRIARGIKAGNRPTDGTPFGGYRGWRYFRCPPFSPGQVDAREGRAAQSEMELRDWAARRDLTLELSE